MERPTHVIDHINNRTRKVTQIWEYKDGQPNKALLEARGYEPAWFFTAGKKMFIRSKVDGKFFDYQYAPDVAPGFTKAG